MLYDLRSIDRPYAVTDPLTALRSATHTLHERLDRNLPLARAEADREDYLRHLQVLHPWLLSLQPALAITGYGSGYAALADRDLRLAGAAPAEGPDPCRAPARDVAFAWGVAYVVEGSQLGGQVLWRRLNERLSPWPLHYLRGRDAATGVHWKTFLADLRAALRQPCELAAACEGARWAFTELLQRFERIGVTT